ncbi:alpha/beta hydrolase [Pseudomonas chlororaphis]|uniref:Alpha/beta hydrolase n=1 Tax=Pseudomonas chlororaphis TaxID=587753 RepID=A0AB34C5G5_9PSED|nr:alpha/beta fold hydrolase [Pseudomonas chlororaphis]KAA5842475.1 alpha/beta hydrolase [Pseudomonas chlororaphis]
MSIKFVEPLLGSTSSADADDLLQKENDSHARAMPMQRLLGGGMDYADAVALHDLGARNVKWADAASHLGELNLAKAMLAEAEGRWETAKSFYYYASACFRFSHSAIFSDSDEKKKIYTKMECAFAAGAHLDRLCIKKVYYEQKGSRLCGWLVQPSSIGSFPLVICLGGFDGWREEYFTGAQYLADRNIATLLLDGPGQGEARLLNNVYLDKNFTSIISAVLDQILENSIFSSIGIWGNSMGGFLATACAISDSRFSACCVNGGTTHPAEILDRYPRFVSKIQAILGIADPFIAAQTMREFTVLGLESELKCDLLQLHGEPDKIFLLENARRIYDNAGSIDKLLVIWRDGDHCIYNHTHEKYTVISDWFSSKLLVNTVSKV